MSSISSETHSKFQTWLHANELHAPYKDFKFAFTSAHKAAEACPEAPEAAANAWENISHNDVEVASSGSCGRSAVIVEQAGWPLTHKTHGQL